MWEGGDVKCGTEEGRLVFFFWGNWMLEFSFVSKENEDKDSCVVFIYPDTRTYLGEKELWS